MTRYYPPNLENQNTKASRVEPGRTRKGAFNAVNMTKLIYETFLGLVENFFLSCPVLLNRTKRGKAEVGIYFYEFSLNKKTGVWGQAVMENAFQTQTSCGQNIRLNWVLVVTKHRACPWQ